MTTTNKERRLAVTPGEAIIRHDYNVFAGDRLVCNAGMKKTGPKPRHGLPAVITVAAKLNTPEVKAMTAAMKAKGIPTRSRFISQAVRAYALQCGVQLPDMDPAHGHQNNHDNGKGDAENRANARLYTDAHNTYNACDMLPSELLTQVTKLRAERNELVGALEDLRKYVKRAPFGTLTEADRALAKHKPEYP